MHKIVAHVCLLCAPFLCIFHIICAYYLVFSCACTIISIPIHAHLCYNIIVPRGTAKTHKPPGQSPKTARPTAILDNFTPIPPAGTRIKAPTVNRSRPQGTGEKSPQGLKSCQAIIPYSPAKAAVSPAKRESFETRSTFCLCSLHCAALLTAEKWRFQLV